MSKEDVVRRVKSVRKKTEDWIKREFSLKHIIKQSWGHRTGFNHLQRPFHVGIKTYYTQEAKTSKSIKRGGRYLKIL